MHCGGPHSRDDCVAEVPQCAGCNGEHRANSRECPLVQHAHDIEQLRSRGLSYQDALTKLKEPGADGNLRKRNFSTPLKFRESNSEGNISQPFSYRDALTKKDSAAENATAVSQSAENATTVSQSVTVGTQTSSIDACTQTYLTGDNLYNCCNKGTGTDDLPQPRINTSKNVSDVGMLQVFLPKFAQCIIELFSLNLSKESPANGETCSLMF